MKTISTNEARLFDAGGASFGFTETIKGDGSYDGKYEAKTRYWIEREGHRRPSSRAEIEATISATLPNDPIGLATYFVRVHGLGRLVTLDSSLIDYAELTGRTDLNPTLEGATLRLVTLECPDIFVYAESLQSPRCVEHRISLASGSIVSQIEIWKGPLDDFVRSYKEPNK